MQSGSELVSEHLARAVAGAAGSIEGCSGVSPEDVEIEVPKEKSHGDMSTNLALVLASRARINPRALAQEIVSRMRVDPDIVESVSVAGPGFVNAVIAKRWLRANVREAIGSGGRYGTSDEGGGRRVQVEFVSANPTGPLNIVSARAAAVGDSLARILRARGYSVDAEYYVNDSGGQASQLAASFEARFRERLGEKTEVPEGGYPGEYLVEMAARLPESDWTAVLNLPPEERAARFGSRAIEEIVAGQKDDLEKFGVEYDNWFRESSLHSTGAVGRALDALRSFGVVERREGAEWFLSTKYGDDSDRVLVKSSGAPTYFLADVAYHADKHSRGYDRVIDIWGPDHHGHIPRMTAATKALGFGEDWLEVLIVQWVNLLRDGEAVGMSKRKGEYVTMRELVDEVGPDCARFLFLTRRSNTPLDFDLELAKRQSDENPVYYVQYCHARIASILRFAAESGADTASLERADTSSLDQPEELDLMRALAAYPRVVAAAARAREPHRLTDYCRELSADFHRFYHKHRVVSERDGVDMGRLALCKAVAVVLANGFSLLGISAPERM
jgi:arginyl-tRNA synthetase